MKEISGLMAFILMALAFIIGSLIAVL